MLSNGPEHLRNVIQYGIKIAFFTKKLQKIAQRLGASPPDPKSLRRLGVPPQTPVRDTFELHKLSQHVPKVRHLHFSTISLSPLSLKNPGYVQTLNWFSPIYLDFISFILRYLCPTKTSSLEKILMTSFYVICGLGLPQSKILGTPMNWRSPEKLF